MTITMVHQNPARVADGVLTIDRKFHEGMLKYCETIGQPLTTIHPALRNDQPIMDRVTVKSVDLPYTVKVVRTNRAGCALPAELLGLHSQFAVSDLVYGNGMNCARIARASRVPYILLLEYDLRTQIIDSTSHIGGNVRRAIRAARCVSNYVASIRDMVSAHSIHCNGYPIYDATVHVNNRRLLYLDSRMASDMLIPHDDLAARLAARTGRPLRLLYSGRYERMKGADDAVKVAIACQRRGLDVEMSCYGQGTLREAMRQLAQGAPQPERITIHDAIPYPDLVTISRTFDVFVCCHIQSDPSCTYLESYGAGLPIVGTGNRMWLRLCRDSSAGLVAPIGDIERLADGVAALAANPDRLAALSIKARAFAEKHCFENEYRKRTDALKRAVDESRSSCQKGRRSWLQQDVDGWSD